MSTTTQDRGTLAVSTTAVATRINIAREYSRFPAGRYRTDGPYSGERFRDEVLVPALRRGGQVEVELDGTAGYGSSFLEEAFGGLIRKHVLSVTEAADRIRLVTSDDSLESEIRGYMQR